jgi:hypothetical protein
MLNPGQSGSRSTLRKFTVKQIFGSGKGHASSKSSQQPPPPPRELFVTYFLKFFPCWGSFDLPGSGSGFLTSLGSEGNAFLENFVNPCYNFLKFVNPVQIPEEEWGRRSFCSSGMTTTHHSFSSWRSWSPGRVPTIFHAPNPSCVALFRIHDILEWIRIRGFMSLTNGSGSWIRILLFSSLTSR